MKAFWRTLVSGVFGGLFWTLYGLNVVLTQYQIKLAQFMAGWKSYAQFWEPVGSLFITGAILTFLAAGLANIIFKDRKQLEVVKPEVKDAQ